VNTKLQWSHGRVNSATNFTKPKKNNTYFFGFLILQQEQKETTTKQNIFGFFNYQTENREQSKPKLEN
jgi:hypothetical protein